MNACVCKALQLCFFLFGDIFTANASSTLSCVWDDAFRIPFALMSQIYPDLVSQVYWFRFFAIHCLQDHQNDSQNQYRVFQLRVLTPSGQFANLQLMTGLSRDNFTRFSTRSPPPLSDYPHCVGTSALQLKIR